jgi:hypothetical protein
VRGPSPQRIAQEKSTTVGDDPNPRIGLPKKNAVFVLEKRMKKDLGVFSRCGMLARRPESRKNDGVVNLARRA